MKLTLMAKNKDALLELLSKVQKASEKAGLYLNLKKTKVMANEPMDNFTLGSEQIEVVKNYIFLGSKIEDKKIAKKRYKED